MTTDQRITRPPAQCSRLFEYFCGNDLAPQSSFEALAAMAARGPGGHTAKADGDGRLINSGAVGFAQRDQLDLLERGNAEGGKRERVSNAQKHREVMMLLEQLSPTHVRILRLAYGPQDQVPELKLQDDPQARKRLEGEDTKVEIRNRTRATQHEKKFGCWRQILPECSTLQVAFAEHMKTSKKRMSICGWLVTVAKPSTINEGQREALAIVREAWNAWMSVSGRPRAPRKFGGEFHREVE